MAFTAPHGVHRRHPPRILISPQVGLMVWVGVILFLMLQPALAAPPRTAPAPRAPASGTVPGPKDPAPAAQDASPETPDPSAEGAAPPAQAPSRKAAASTPAEPPARKAAPPPREGSQGDAQASEAPDDRPRPEATRPTPGPNDDGPETEEVPMRRLQGTAWAMVGITAVLLTVTGIFALLVEDREDEIERMATFLDPYDGRRPLPYSGVTKRDYEQFHKEGRRFQAAGFTFLGLSATAALSAAALFVADHLTKNRERPKRALRIDPVLGPRGAGIGLGLEF